MQIRLEQDLAAAVRFIQDHAAEGTKMYFDELPERFCVPSVYFQVPLKTSKRSTLRAYGNTITMNVWFMASTDWDAQAEASDMMECIMLNRCEMPVFDLEGNAEGRSLRVEPPEIRRIDEGIVQLTFSFTTYFHPSNEVGKVQSFSLAWNKAKQVIG